MSLNLQSRTRGDKIDHRWRMVAHIDGCHFYASTYVCYDCGASYHISLERDIAGDPYSAIWMDPDALPEDEQCERCEQLMQGAAVAEPREEYIAA